MFGIKKWFKNEIAEAKAEVIQEIREQGKLIVASIISTTADDAVDAFDKLTDKTKTRVDDEVFDPIVNGLRGVLKRGLGF